MLNPRSWRGGKLDEISFQEAETGRQTEAEHGASSFDDWLLEAMIILQSIGKYSVGSLANQAISMYRDQMEQAAPTYLDCLARPGRAVLRLLCHTAQNAHPCFMISQLRMFGGWLQIGRDESYLSRPFG